MNANCRLIEGAARPVAVTVTKSMAHHHNLRDMIERIRGASIEKPRSDWNRLRLIVESELSSESEGESEQLEVGVTVDQMIAWSLY
jgi:hypothetical protein